MSKIPGGRRTVRHTDGLSYAEMERLDLLAERCARVIVAISRIRRIGYDGKMARGEGMGSTPRETLEVEMATVNCIANLMVKEGDMEDSKLEAAEDAWGRTLFDKTKYQG